MAVHLLCDTKLSIEEIALDVGYENQSYFFRQFKKRYGMTPHKYRKENIKDKKLHIPQELRIRSRGTERHSASN